MEKDYYKILGVPKDADSATIKKAFRKLAKQYHPDTNAGNAKAEQQFQEINEAYSVLGDEEKKKVYDEGRAGKRATSEENGQRGNKANTQKGNPFAGFTAQNFKMDFGDMMFDEINNKKREEQKNADINFADVSSQFASFFGFKPK